MPQMMPMKWLILFIYFLILLYLMIMLISSLLNLNYLMKKLFNLNKFLMKKISLMLILLINNNNNLIYSSNLFSIFDPSTSNYFSLNWLSSFFPFLMIPLIFWLIPNRFMNIQMMLLMNLKNEFSLLLNLKINKFNLIILISLFYYIMFTNYLGLFNYIFTSSSHLIFSLSYSLLLWLIIMIFGWFKNLNHMFIHLVPQGTPSILMPFMVIIETISNIIRPITLAVRLSANMIAGHLLITLMSNNGFNMMLLILILMLFMQNMLMLLEISVSLIQAYVFTVLTLLYSTDSS